MSTPQSPWSAICTPAGATDGTTPSSVNLSPAAASSSFSPNGPPGQTPVAMTRDHEEDAARPTASEFRCTYCDQSRSTMANLNRHINTHARPYACRYQDCRARKATQRDLNRHQDTHGKIRLYFCPVAGCSWHVNGSKAGFSRRLDNAKRHLKSHNNHQDISVLREDSQGRLSRV